MIHSKIYWLTSVCGVLLSSNVLASGDLSGSLTPKITRNIANSSRVAVLAAAVSKKRFVAFDLHGRKHANDVRAQTQKAFVDWMSRQLMASDETPYFTDTGKSAPLSRRFTDFSEVWHPFFYQRLDPDSLQVASSEEWFRHERSANAIPNQTRKFGKRMTDLDYLPQRISLEVFTKWKECLDRQSTDYLTGKSSISGFQLDVLGRKTKLIESLLVKQGQLDNHSLLNKNVGTVDAYSILELESFFYNIAQDLGKDDARQFYFSPEVRGVPFCIVYERGTIKEAYLTEDPSKKTDVLDLVRAMKNIPKYLLEDSSITVSGVLYINLKDFHALNYKRRSLGKRDWIDSRAAIMHALLEEAEPNKTLEMKLRCYFDKLLIDGLPPASVQTLTNMHSHIEKKGFPVLSRTVISTDTWKHTPLMALACANMPFECKGLRIQTNDLNELRLAKKHTCNYMFVPHITRTTAKNIYFKVLTNGNVVAIVEVEPKESKGKIISKFIINNRGLFSTLNVRVGDNLLISTFPNLQPQLLMSLRDGGGDEIFFPTKCPKCNANLTTINKNNETISYCSTHLSCDTDETSDIQHFTSVCGLHVPSLSHSIIQELMKKFLVTSIEDIYTLSLADHILLDLNISDFHRLLLEIQHSKKTTLARFIYALNIPTVTYLMAEEIAYLAGTLDRLMKLTKEELASLEYIDPEASKHILTFFKDSKTTSKINKILKAGVIVAEPNPDIIALCYKKLSLCDERDYKNVIAKILECNTSYAMSDFEFDLLNKTADSLEKLYPSWRIPRVSKSENRKRVSWVDPIRLKKTYLAVELKHLLTKSKSSEFVVEPKINGVACALQYESGKLIKAMTKSDKQTGLDILDYVSRIPKIPKILAGRFTGIIRGELYMSEKDFHKINAERQRSGLLPYVDSLGVVVGSLKKKETNIQIHGVIQFYGYHISEDSTHQNRSEIPKERIELRTFLQELGIHACVDKNLRVFKNVKEIISFVSDIEKRRMEVGTNIDGMVIKSNDVQNQDVHIAFKFNQESKLSKIVGVSYNITKSGKLSAVAQIDPIKFSNGREVSRVYLPDPNTVLYEGDLVKIKYSGGTTPVLQEIENKKRKSGATRITAPINCPGCGKKLEAKHKGLKNCLNPRCSGAQNSKDLQHFARAMRISSNINTRIIQNLIDNGLIVSRSDFYKILPEDLNAIINISDTERQAFLANIESSKTTTKKQFLRALQIRCRETLIEKFYDGVVLDESGILLPSNQELYAIGLSKKSTETVLNFLNDNKDEINYLVRSVLRFVDNREITPEKIGEISRALSIRNASSLDSLKSLEQMISAFMQLDSEALITLDRYKHSENDVSLSGLIGQIKQAQKSKKKLLNLITNEIASLTSNPKRPDVHRDPEEAFLDSIDDDEISVGDV